MKNNHKEDDEQKALFQYAAYNKELEWYLAVPNGGKRNIREATRLKSQGVKAGVHDTFLPKARGIYHGLWLELKIGKNKLSEKQNKFAIDMVDEGYCVCVCYSSAEAIKAIKTYMGLKPDEFISESCPYLSAHYIKP